MPSDIASLSILRNHFDCVTLSGRGGKVSTSESPTTAILRVSGSNFSMRLLGAAIVTLFLYYAAGVVITVLLSILIAYFLDPAVEFLERLRIPRTIGSLIMVMILIVLLLAAIYGLWTR